ncbi:MAG: TetR/AcrR family transcriptional regulator [Clostridium sp.]
MINHRKQKILDGANHVISTKGIQHASVREISKAAGVTTGAIYHHYKCKEDILYDLMAESLHKSSQVLEETKENSLQGEDVLNAVIEGVRERFTKDEENKVQFYLAMTGIEDNEEIRNRFKTLYSQWIENIEDLLKAAYKNNNISNVNALSSFLLAAIDGYILQYMLGANTCTPEEFTKVYSDLLFNGLENIIK